MQFQKTCRQTGDVHENLGTHPLPDVLLFLETLLASLPSRCLQCLQRALTNENPPYASSRVYCLGSRFVFGQRLLETIQTLRDLQILGSHERNTAC